jgi:hypothetical protein
MAPIRHSLALLLAAAVAAGCAATQEAPERKITRSGFLHDYSLLKDCGGERAARCWTAQGVNWASYDKILLDPVTTWRAKDSHMAKIDPKDRQALTNNFYRVMYQALSKDYQMVDAPEPDTLRIKLALTDAEASNVTMDTVSSVVPQMRMLTTLGGYATGKPAFTGQAQVEYQVTDASTGRLLAQGVDRRVGAKQISGSTNAWSDVEDAMLTWASMVRRRLCVERGVNPDACPAVQYERGI